MLTQIQIRQYHEDGFVVPDFRMPGHVLESIRDRHTRLLKGHPEFRHYCPALLHFDLDFAEYCKTPGLLDLVEQLIGPDLALWNMSFFGQARLRRTGDSVAPGRTVLGASTARHLLGLGGGGRFPP